MTAAKTHKILRAVRLFSDGSIDFFNSSIAPDISRKGAAIIADKL
jgi:hypothetical protein